MKNNAINTKDGKLTKSDLNKLNKGKYKKEQKSHNYV